MARSTDLSDNAATRCIKISFDSSLSVSSAKSYNSAYFNVHNY